MTTELNISPKINRKRLLRLELILMAVLGIATFIVAAKFDILEKVVDFSHRHENFELDELISVTFFLVFALAFFSMRRWKELRVANHFLARKNIELAEQKETIRAAQTMLIQQEKLAAIGQLAAGAAHEINNPLGYIASNLSSLQNYGLKFNDYLNSLDTILDTLPLEQQQQIKNYKKQYKVDFILEDLPNLISEANEGTARIATIIQGLKLFSRADDEAPSQVDINECLGSAIKIAWNNIKYNSKLEQDFGDLPLIDGFPQQLSQVFMNLMINASHAIETDGLIQIKSCLKGSNVVVTVTDNGSGIPEANLGKIFDPFFTTKDVGEGTGLGMSIASEIIQKHGGSIAVQSVVGKGTKFTVSLPILIYSVKPQSPPSDL